MARKISWATSRARDLQRRFEAAWCSASIGVTVIQCFCWICSRRAPRHGPVPQVPEGQADVAGSNIRLAGGAVDVAAAHSGNSYRTNVTLRVPLSSFTIGQTLPRGAGVAAVTLDGQPAAYRTELTNRGLEVLVSAPASGAHALVVTAR